MKQDKIFISGYAKLPEGITATELYSVVGVALLIQRESGIIEDSDCTLVTEIGRNYMKALIKGKNLNNLEAIIEDLSDNYFGSAKKALISAFKQCFEKYRLIKEDREKEDCV